MTSESRLERLPSISSCFPERFSGLNFDESSNNSTVCHPSAILHPLPPVPLPHVPVDKHLIVEQPGVPKTCSKNSAPAFSSFLVQQHASTNDHVIGSAQDDKTSRSPLPTPLLSVHNFHIERPVPPDMSPKSSESPLSIWPSRQHAKTNFRDQINCSAPAPTTQDEKISRSSLPTPPFPIPSFLRNGSVKQLTLYAPLYQSAMKGDWEMAKNFLRSHPGAINVRITKAMDTVLHIAAGAKRTKFVQEVVKSMSVTDLALRNSSGHTALCFAAASGVTEIAKVMVNKNKSLPGIRGNKGVTPLYVAALFGHREMVHYLNHVTRDEDLTQEDLIGLLIATIKTDLFDMALSIIQKYPELAVIGDSNGETVLHVLARKPSAFSSKSGLGFWQTFVYQWTYVEPVVKSICPSTYGNHTFKINQVFLHSIGKLLLTLQLIVPGIEAVYDKKRLHAEALALLKLVWEQVLQLDGKKLTDLLKSPSDPLFIAAEFGIAEFVTEIIHSYPDLIWKVDKHN
ncbi:uncharacterized protein LOC110817376, partial [Carica papaya]|uniref:uncharacterized protein LOC110817376 n=1 Tax=Carica papaya TaxID=3649 RepID=UPI000B8D1792